MLCLIEEDERPDCEKRNLRSHHHSEACSLRARDVKGNKDCGYPANEQVCKFFQCLKED